MAEPTTGPMVTVAVADLAMVNLAASGFVAARSHLPTAALAMGVVDAAGGTGAVIAAQHRMADATIASLATPPPGRVDPRMVAVIAAGLGKWGITAATAGSPIANRIADDIARAVWAWLAEGDMGHA